MKVLIWFLCIFVYALVTTLVQSGGVMLGAIPTVVLFGGMMWLARTLCKKWDEHKANNEAEKRPPVHKAQSVIQSNADDTICFCRKCGEKLMGNRQFCGRCGTEVVKE